MEVITKYVVYEYKPIIRIQSGASYSEAQYSLIKVEFVRLIYNGFLSEEDAINALIKDGKTEEDYVILKEVYIRP